MVMEADFQRLGLRACLVLSWGTDPVHLMSPGGAQSMPHRALLCTAIHVYCYV